MWTYNLAIKGSLRLPKFMIFSDIIQNKTSSLQIFFYIDAIFDHEKKSSTNVKININHASQSIWTVTEAPWRVQKCGGDNFAILLQQPALKRAGWPKGLKGPQVVSQLKCRSVLEYWNIFHWFAKYFILASQIWRKEQHFPCITLIYVVLQCTLHNFNFESFFGGKLI